MGTRVPCPPGVRAAHHGAPHAWFVHPVRWSVEVDVGMACAHELARIRSAFLSLSHKHGLPESSGCDVTRSIQEAGGWWGGQQVMQQAVCVMGWGGSQS